jgi:radical SAM protein with 4Fe4S-binding SPASM domain
MTLNRHEFDAMRALADAYGVEFRFDPAIFPRFDGDRSVLRFRVSAEEAIEREFEDPDRVHQWRQYWEERRDLPVSAELYDCGASRTAFHIDPYGNLQPCLMTVSCKYDLLKGSFRATWQEAMPSFRERKAAKTNACNACPHRILCASCPALAELETGDADTRSEYLCAMTALRWAALNGEH